ncbi:MAG: carbohydrate ABC transporter permease [Akkermansiaceae bacterium]|nr:carbohydrate ABC transporter permease [Armatimonadota bacterium]
MPHIARIGSKSPKTRLGIAAIYAVLILGAITTVYPFLLMVGTGMKSQNDYNDFTPGALVPRYLYDDAALFNKYAEDKYANNLDDINAAYNTNFDKPVSVAPPSKRHPINIPVAASWSTFVTELPPSDKKVGFAEHDAAPSLLLLKYRDWLRNKFNDDIRAMNEAYTEESVSFDTVAPPFERTALRDWKPDLAKPKVRDWYAFRETLPEHFFIPMLADPMYRTWLRQEVYEEDLAALNASWGANYDDWNAVVLPRTAPAPPKARADWETFVRTKLPLRMTGGVPVATAPASTLVADTPENRWRETIKGKNFSDSIPPQAYIDQQYIQTHKAELRQDYATRNFSTVAGYIFLHGNAVPNTVIFCVLAILSAVIVNPLCAYALSRYPLPYAYQVLLFLLATMAFPAEVAMIPNFLLLRDLHLLNTFWALVLPGLANGFSIFLLKGFFDSLPKELYEAAILDGATEVGMFRTITVPLSLPIFSVIALNAFTASYGAFLFAMVVCQDPKMWTLMVWLYDLQASAPQYVIMAALTLAALPTLIVFMFAQKIIMRGIILPSFK